MHPFRFDVRRPRWPPFYATALFLPRVTMRVTNEGPDLERGSLDAEILQYDGPLGQVSGRQEGWVDFWHLTVDDGWPKGETRRMRIRVPSRRFRGPGRM